MFQIFLKKHGSVLLVFFLLGLAFYYRFIGLGTNHPFWVDEFSTANQARLVLRYGTSLFSDKTVHFETHNALYHFIVAGFYRLFGQSESITRLPSVIVGSLVPVFLFLLGKRIFNFATGLTAALLATTSYFLITWSQQARSYVFIQFFLILTTLLYFKIVTEKNYSRKYVILFTLSILLGALFHSFFYLFTTSLLVHFFFYNHHQTTKWLKKPATYVIAGVVILFSAVSGLLPSIFDFFKDGIITANNLKYYHSYLWREYSILTFLFLLGLLFTFVKNRSFFLFSTIYISMHMIFVNFLFRPYVSRYLLPIWPFMLLYASYALNQIGDLLVLRLKKSHPTAVPSLLSSTIITFALGLFIVINGHKFTIKPKPFYSVNHDFREIALIDYHQVYGIIKSKGDVEKGSTAVIDTWYDRLYWYLGQDWQHAFLFRWMSEEGTTHGLSKKTDFVYNDLGEKIVPRAKNLGFIGELSDLTLVMKKYPKGFIFIDDTSMPQDVIQYVQTHLKKEIHLDHSPLDDNPYSIWPATLYSWGID